MLYFGTKRGTESGHTILCEPRCKQFPANGVTRVLAEAFTVRKVLALAIGRRTSSPSSSPTASEALALAQLWRPSPSLRRRCSVRLPRTQLPRGLHQRAVGPACCGAVAQSGLDRWRVGGQPFLQAEEMTQAVDRQEAGADGCAGRLYLSDVH